MLRFMSQRVIVSLFLQHIELCSYFLYRTSYNTVAVPTKSPTVQSTVLYDYAHATYSTKNNDIGTEIVQVLVKIASKSLQHPCTELRVRENITRIVA